MLYKHGIINKIWLMDPSFGANYLPLVVSYIKGNNNLQPVERSLSDDLRFAVGTAGSFEISEYGEAIPPEDAPDGSIAIINITGAITKHDQDCGPSGMVTKSNILERCYANKNIKGVVLKIDSGGGSGDAMRLLNETISERNKPMVAFIDDNACSAAYGIASGCDIVVANSNTAYVGSIGTYISIADYTEYLKKEGISIIEVYATASKDKNIEVREALKGNVAPLRKYADKFNEMFLSMVETARKDQLKTDRSTWGTGKLYYADEAMEIGLIDAIDKFTNILNYFV